MFPYQATKTSVTFMPLLTALWPNPQGAPLQHTTLLLSYSHHYLA